MGRDGTNWHPRWRQGAEAQGDTGLQVEQRGRIEKSLEDFRQGSDEMESSFLKDQIGFYTENSFGGGWGWRGQAGWKQEGQVEDHYRDPGDSTALMSDAMFSLSPQTTPQGAKWNTRTRAWCKDSAALTRCTSGVGWLGCCCGWVTSVVSDSVWPHRWQPTRLPHPWDSPGKNTGVGCHFLLQFMKVKTESEVAQSCPTLSDPMDCSLPGSSIHGVFQAGVLEWGAISRSSRLSRFEGRARWAVTARCGQLRRSHLGEAVSFSIQESIQRWQPKATLLWLRLQG